MLSLYVIEFKHENIIYNCQLEITLVSDYFLEGGKIAIKILREEGDLIKEFEFDVNDNKIGPDMVKVFLDFNEFNFVRSTNFKIRYDYYDSYHKLKEVRFTNVYYYKDPRLT